MCNKRTNAKYRGVGQPKCSRCLCDCATLLCPACIKAKQEYIDAVNDLLAAGVPISSGEINNRNRDQDDIDAAIERGATL